MKPVIISKEAKVEIKEAIAFLNSRRPGIGYEFEDEVRAAVKLVGKQPKAFSPHKNKGFRKIVIDRFGYLIFSRSLKNAFGLRL